MKTVIEMADEVFERMFPDGHCRETYWTATEDELERFAEIVRADERERIYFQTSSDFVKAAVAEEREACAKVCDDLALPPDVARSNASIWEVATLDCAEAIRARSNT